MKKTLTPEQIEARKQRLEALKDFIKNTTPEQREKFALEHGISNPEGHQLSGTNQMLIAFQLAQFSIVAGFLQWKRNGRQVRKGEHGATIWIPIQTKQAETEETETNFTTTTVFDISQTEELTEV